MSRRASELPPGIDRLPSGGYRARAAFRGALRDLWMNPLERGRELVGGRLLVNAGKQLPGASDDVFAALSKIRFAAAWRCD